jgi:UDP-GlcNAc:undecaprenyl-phosphate GlcNAc-1-phosphate transferase
VVVLALIAAVLSGAWAWSVEAEYVMGPAFLLAVSAAAALTPVAMYLSVRWGVLDVPDARKNHERPMPLLGGGAVLVAFVAAGVVGLAALSAAGRGMSPQLRAQLGATLAGAVLIAAMGAADDAWGLKAGVRLVGQLAVVALVMKFGVVMTFLPPTPAGHVGEVLLTVLWLVGITNALNFLDGLDGLASGVSAVAALSFGAIAAMTGQYAVATGSFCLAGAALGFFAYNSRPARIYLGDSGATCLGFVLACLGIIGDWGRDAPVENLFVPVIVLGIPIYDTIYITIYRFKAGHVRNLSEWAAYVGRDHLHHRLLHLGMRPRYACLFICLGGVALGILAIILQTKTGGLDRYDKFLALGLAVILFVGATILMELGRNGRERG